MLMRMLRGLLLGHYESKPITMMDEAGAKAWVVEHPRCSMCPYLIDPDRDNFVLINDSARGISAHHHHCPIPSPMHQP